MGDGRVLADAGGRMWWWMRRCRGRDRRTVGSNWALGQRERKWLMFGAQWWNSGVGGAGQQVSTLAAGSVTARTYLTCGLA